MATRGIGSKLRSLWEDSGLAKLVESVEAGECDLSDNTDNELSDAIGVLNEIIEGSEAAINPLNDELERRSIE